MKWKFRIGAVAGNALEFYDIAVFGAISVYLAAEFERQGYTQGHGCGVYLLCASLSAPWADMS